MRISPCIFHLVGAAERPRGGSLTTWVDRWIPRLNQLLPDIEATDPQMAELIRRGHRFHRSMIEADSAFSYVWFLFGYYDVSKMLKDYQI